MRLAFKIMTGVMLVVAVLLAIHSYLVVKREIAQFRDDMDLHAYLLGTVLATSVSDVWNSAGPERANSIITDANLSERLVRVRLVWFDTPAGDSAAPMVRIDNRSTLEDGKEVLFPEYSLNGSKFHIAYFPVSIDSTRLCALELSQPLSPMYRYIRITVLQKVILFVAFLIVGGALVWWFGIRLVGRPINTLVGQAQSVGQGNLNATNQLERSGDEIGALARGLNQMVFDLRTVRAHLEQETAQRIATVEQLNHAERLSTAGKLASGLAHELGTPLNVVSGHAKMIADGAMSQSEISESAGVVRQQAERMASLIRKLLDFARRAPQEMLVEGLAHSVEQMIAMLSPLAAEHGVTIVGESDGEAPMVRVDSAQIQQVLSNLIVNAIHAMPEGGRVMVRYGQRQVQPPADHGGPMTSYAFIEVIDEGIGIPEENLSRIFTPFFSTKQVGDGTGLGLSIAHGIVKEHGGWITVQSMVGAGSTFSIFLPLSEKGLWHA